MLDCEERWVLEEVVEEDSSLIGLRVAVAEMDDDPLM